MALLMLNAAAASMTLIESPKSPLRGREQVSDFFCLENTQHTG